MKEVRLNDKLWFGKHKDTRISDIIKADPSFIQKLVKEGKIKLNEKCQFLYDSKYGGIDKKIKSPSRYGGFIGIEGEPGVGANINGRQYIIGENPRPTPRSITMGTFRTRIPTGIRVNIIPIIKDSLVSFMVRNNVPLEHLEFVMARLSTKVEANPFPNDDDYDYDTIFNIQDFIHGRIGPDTLNIRVINNAGTVVSVYNLG